MFSTGSHGSTASDGSTDCSTHSVDSEVSTCSYGSTLFQSLSVLLVQLVQCWF